MSKNISPRFCRVHDSLTSDQFGCEPAYFDQYIKDQNLRIIAQVVGYYIVLDPEEEEWTISQDDVSLIGEEAAA